jgi:signal transduction histidine kinase
VGYISFTKGEEYLEQSTITHLVSTNESKKGEFEQWIKNKVTGIEMLAALPFFQTQFPDIMASHGVSSPVPLDSHQLIAAHLLPAVQTGLFKEVCIIRAGDGLVLVSTNPGQEGKYLDYQPYFTRGLENTYVQNVYYDVSRQLPDMVIGTPLISQKGDVLGVLSAHLNLIELSRIMEKRNKLLKTEDNYIVNNFNYFITEPRFGKGFALKKAVHTRGVELALEHQNGVDFYPDYRGVPVIGVYSWMEERELCMISEIDQSSAYAPVRLLKNVILAVAAFVGIFVTVLGWFIAAGITRPLSRLAAAAEEIGSGNLKLTLDIKGTGEIQQLEQSFSRMVKRLKQTLVSRDELSREVEERVRAERTLEKTMTDLKQSNKDLQQFAYVASHDLQEPLRMVASYTQLLSERYKDRLDEKANKYIFYAVDGASRMQRLIQDLLTYSRVNTHGSAFEPVDLNAVLSVVLKQLEIQITETKARIHVNDMPIVRADASQLNQLFLNLISNAVKFCKDKTPEILVSSKREENRWCLSVSDNGIGIEQKYRDKIFIIFQRLHSRNEYPGTGIGLAICKRIVQRHGGDIWFESEPGKGSVFNLTLPI